MTNLRGLPQHDDRRFSPDGIAGARTQLIAALETVLRERSLSQVSAARLLQTDQPTLSKVLRGRTESVSLDKLMEWLLILGRSVEIHVIEGCAQGGALKVMASEHADASR
jgi:predicted XRE-type DNA-binding protein